MKLSPVKSALALLALAAAAPAAHAGYDVGSSSPNFYTGVQVGQASVGGYHSTSFGAYLGWSPLPALALELSGTRLGSETDLYADYFGNLYAVTTAADAYALSAVVMSTDFHGLSAFARGGVADTRLSVSGLGWAASDKASLVYGGGLQWQFAGPVFARGEYVRYDNFAATHTNPDNIGLSIGVRF